MLNIFCFILSKSDKLNLKFFLVSPSNTRKLQESSTRLELDFKQCINKYILKNESSALYNNNKGETISSKMSKPFCISKNKLYSSKLKPTFKKKILKIKNIPVKLKI